MALGASRRRLAPGLFREVFTLSTVSALAGLLTGFPFVWILWSLFRMLIVDSAQMDLVLDFRCLLVSIPFFLIVVLFSCITAFRYLKRTNIMDTIREEHKNEPVRELGRWCGPVGIIVLLIGAVIGIVFVGILTSVVHWAGSPKFCGEFCHSMDLTYAAY